METRAYPPGGCYGSFFHNHNCLTDAQLQAAIKRVMAFKGWSGGMGNIFLLFTPRGEASCFGFGCSYTDYRAYHGTFLNAAGQIVIYSNQPYAEVSVCQASGVPSPNGNRLQMRRLVWQVTNSPKPLPIP